MSAAARPCASALFARLRPQWRDRLLRRSPLRRRPLRRRLLPRYLLRCCLSLLSVLLLLGSLLSPALAYTPDSPEVQAMVVKALAFLEKNADPRLGGKCLVGLAFHKRGLPDTHPRIVEAVAACKELVESERNNVYIYSKALAIIFLSELDAAKHGELIRAYASMLPAHQKEHGGFGYIGTAAGDTSQTQYTALAYWELLNHGISPDAKAVQQCLNWLLRTQDPTGVWGYQGEDPGSYSLIPQANNPGRSMGAAGMSSAMILGNALGLLTGGSSEQAHVLSDQPLPAALHRVERKSDAKRAPTLPAGNVSPQLLTECLNRGRGWWTKNFSIEVNEYQLYYLYSLERLKSFEGFLAGGEDAEPDWYNEGVAYLKKNQAADGSWTDTCGAECATAFGTLFLLRSTQQSIKASLGEGTLVGGRGLPRDLSKVRLQGGRLVVQQQTTELDQMLDMMESDDDGALDGLIDNPAALTVTEVTPAAARRLQQIVRSGSPDTRLLAVRALARARDLDFAPTLIFAMTDPNRQVVRVARDGLRSVSRNFAGYGPPDNFDDNERDQAIVRWKAWYATVRPDAPPLP